MSQATAGGLRPPTAASAWRRASSSLSRARAVIHELGPVWHSVRASTAIPAIFPPLLHHDGDVLVDGKIFANYDAYPPAHLGRIPLWSALAHSCNTAFISQHERLAERLAYGR